MQKFLSIVFYKNLATIFTQTASSLVLRKVWVAMHAINTVGCVIEQLTKGGNTVNLCAIDLSKAFDKVNHHALLIKLMKKNYMFSC